MQFPGLLYFLEELVHVGSDSEETCPEEKCPLWGMLPLVGTLMSGLGPLSCVSIKCWKTCLH